MAKLDPQTVAAVMVHAVRSPLVASQLRQAGVKGEDFLGTPHEMFAAIVDALLEYGERQSDAPPFLAMSQICARRIYNDPLIQPFAPQAMEFLRYAYGVAEDQLSPLYVTEPGGVLQQVVDEVKVAPALRRAALETDPVRRDRLIAAVGDLRSRTRVTAANSVDLFDPEVMARLTSGTRVRETGVDYLDKAVRGLPPVALAGLIAGTGGGKTMFGTQLACESVLRNRNTVYFQYEQILGGDVAERFYSYAGGASRAELAGGYADYPAALKERIAKLRPLFVKHFRIYGMAGDVDNQGGGGVAEMGAILRRLEMSEGWRAELVVVDWLEPLWASWERDASREKARDKREEYKLIIANLKELRDAFKLDLVLLHQIAPGLMEKMSPAARPEKTMAEEVKAFPNLMDACFCFGRKDEASDCMWFVVSKARWAPTASRIVQMDAARNRILDRHGLYALNELHRMEGEPVFVRREASGRDGKEQANLE
jgi:hypothetical protein